VAQGASTSSAPVRPHAPSGTGLQRSSEPEAPRNRLSRLRQIRAAYLRHAPRIVTWIAWLLGVLVLTEAVWETERLRVHALVKIIPVPATAAATAVTAVCGLLLLRLAAGLRKRKRAEWLAAVAITIVMCVAHLVRTEGHPIEAAVMLLLLVALLAARSRFTAKPDPRSRWFAARVFVQFTAVAIAFGLVLLYAYPRHIAGSPSFWLRLREVVQSLVGAGGVITLRGERFSDIFHGSLLAFGLVTAVVVVLLALRPPEPVARLSDEDERRLRGLLARTGQRDSLGYFALRRDKSVVWSPSGKAAVTYRVVGGVALASGDPIGDPEAWPGAIAAYRALVEEYAWTPAVMGCSELGATVYRRECHLAALALGDEAIVEVDEFSLDGRAMRGVRQACTRVCRAGYQVQVRRMRDVPADEIAALQQAAAAWRGDAVERGFSMALSRLGDPDDGDCVVATAMACGQLRGLLHFVPWGSDGLSLDLMRRDRSSDNGLNEYMIASVIRACPDLGVRRVSLNFAVFRDAIERGEKIGAGPVLRLWRSLLIFASRWWQIESLYRFNVKFRPYWEPRFISYPAARDLPRIAVAALEAEAFLVRPHRLRRLLGRD
jgi:lysyl-tRNA synthetase, class II